MSIQSEITRISGNVSDSLDAIAAKGVTVPSGATSDDLSTLIAAIQQGGSVDVPVFTLTQDAYGTVLSITCDKTYAQCEQFLENKGNYAAVVRIDPTYSAEDMLYGLCNGYTDYDSTPYALYGPFFRDDGLYDIKYRSNGNIELVSSEFYGEEGTPIATKGAVSNHSITVTPSVVNTRGFIEGNTTITGTPVTVSASELASGTYSITSSGIQDITGYASISVPSGIVTVPSSIDGSQATVSATWSTLTFSRMVSVTPDVITAGYISSGTSGYTQVNLTASIYSKDSSDLTVSGATVTAPSGYYPATASKTIASGTAKTPSTTITANPSISINSSTGVITATASVSKSITPAVNSGYISAGQAGTVKVSGSSSYNLTTVGTTTYTPSAATQTIPSGVFLTGAQIIEPIPISVDNHRLVLPEGLISI